MKENSKKKDLLIAFGLNIVFFVVFVFLFGPKHETNDDLALSLLVEGAYGEKTPYMIYSNILWGKLLVGLYTVMPNIKWYIVLMLLMLFLSYLGITYIILRLQGRKAGLVSSTTILMFLGYYSYVVFQYSRIAPIVTTGGILLLFYAIEHTNTKCEKWLCLVMGTFMAVWGSLIRFQMFALAVVLAGGVIGLYKVWEIWKEKEANWVKQIGVYVAVFGTVGVLSLGCYVFDRMQYSSEEWKYYQEFNTVRTELWDYGFPLYVENTEYLESLGISLLDYQYYLSWNMDEELLPLETLHKIAELKPDKQFQILGFLSVFPKLYFGISAFILFLVLSLIAIGINWKNIYFIIFEFLGVMVFEAYFYYIGRYGIARVDHAMWMVAVLTLIYAISKDVKNMEVFLNMSWERLVLLFGIIGVIFIADYVRVPLEVDGTAGETKAFYDEVMEDDEHLYVLISRSPRIYYAFDFWEPSKEGDLSNVYNVYGWEFNHEVKRQALKEYGLTNIYRDSINNEKVYFASNIEVELLELYIKQNYDSNAELIKVKEINDIAVWSLCSW